MPDFTAFMHKLYGSSNTASQNASLAIKIVATVSILLSLTACVIPDDVDQKAAAFPKSVKIVRVLGGSIDHGLMNYQGVVIYQLSDETAEGLLKHGIAYLGPDMHPRNSWYNFQYGSWHQTPLFGITDFHQIDHNYYIVALRILDCEDIGSRTGMKDRYGICAGLLKQGNYYAFTSSGSLILLMPRQKIALFVADDS